MKSNVNTEELLVVRQQGRVGFIVNRLKNITYKPLLVDYDRIIGIPSGGKTLLRLFEVYLPHYDCYNDQTQLYSETLVILQSAVDCMEPSPMIIVGDMNANLPRHANSQGTSIDKHPYNKHSYILYDF